jgi:hypothetical protein
VVRCGGAGKKEEISQVERKNRGKIAKSESRRGTRRAGRRLQLIKGTRGSLPLDSHDIVLSVAHRCRATDSAQHRPP